MAKCTIDPFTGEIVTISGKLGNMLFKTYRNGQVRGYLLPSTPTPRSTPLSEKEIASRNLFAIAATVTKHRIEAGDTRRRSLIFKEVYASLKTQLQRDRNGGGTWSERGQVLSKPSNL